ncbi:ATP synthase F1 subunit delta [Buchnera aphidicola (Chaitoregma tattakana)]|uniref:ATP synthase F1 subunit delta n=1 Tax=Buchnera aphidicola TaxID=9 RepID=UPI0031B8A670
MINKTLSRPYALAAFNFSKKNFVTFKWYNMLRFTSKLSVDSRIKNIVNCIFGSKFSSNIFIKICANNIDLNFCNFIRLLSEDNKLFLLKDIKYMFYEYWKSDKDVVSAIVYSSKILSMKFMKSIHNFVKNNFSKKVFLKNILDKSIIYGFVIKVNDFIFNNSFNSDLKKIKKYMLDVL